MYALQSPFLTLNLYVLKKIKGGGIWGLPETVSENDQSAIRKDFELFKIYKYIDTRFARQISI